MRVLLPLLLSALVSDAADKRPVTPEDYLQFASVADPQVSPDGNYVAYTVTRVETKANRRISDIWLAGIDGREAPRPYVSSQSATSPRWSARGLGFISARPMPDDPAPRPQVWLMPMEGGEPRRLTMLKNGVTAFTWSPDGKRLVAVSRTGPAERPTDTRHYLSSYYKFNGRSWFDTMRTHLWVVDLDTLAARQITSGDQRNDLDPQWSPDGKRIAFAAERTDTEPGDVNDILVVPAEGGEPRSVTDQHEGSRNPRWSPDGSWIAFLASSRTDEAPIVCVVDSSGGTAKRLVRKVEYAPTSLSVSADGNALLFISGWKGEQHLYTMDTQMGNVTPVTSGPRYISGVAFGRGKTVYAANDATHLDELYVGERRLTHTNDALLDSLDLVEIERIPYKSVDGWNIDGFLMKPVGWQPGRKYPMVLSIHGGPAGQYGIGWYHEHQVYASRGWAVFFANPRGSTGYGTEFQRGVKMEWGGKAYDDLMRGVDTALARYPWIDGERLGVTGGSYGGFMTNWIVSHTNRFKAAVTLRSISNFISDDGTRDGAYGHQRDFGGDIFENYDFYWKSSPLAYAKNVKTPTLILHSDDDQRVPLEQGEQWFRALQHFHVPSEFVIFPRENHDLTRNGEPKHLVESLKWQVYWFDRYLNGNAKSAPPDAP
jgi:dipeptidyl aminopeptidase/acylaminoacyl peptidase